MIFVREILVWITAMVAIFFEPIKHLFAVIISIDYEKTLIVLDSVGGSLL
jgi:hypothetical protein